MTPLGLLLGNTPNFTFTYGFKLIKELSFPQPFDDKDTATFYSLQIF